MSPGRLTQDLGAEQMWEIGGLTHTAAAGPALLPPCPAAPGAGPCAVWAGVICAEGGTLTPKSSTFPLLPQGKELSPLGTRW